MKTTDAMQFSSLIHKLILEPEKFAMTSLFLRVLEDKALNLAKRIKTKQL